MHRPLAEELLLQESQAALGRLWVLWWRLRNGGTVSRWYRRSIHFQKYLVVETGNVTFVDLVRRRINPWVTG